MSYLSQNREGVPRRPSLRLMGTLCEQIINCQNCHGKEPIRSRIRYDSETGPVIAT